MHSSRMRTVRCSGRLRGEVSAPGGVCLEEDCLPRGCLPRWVSAQGRGCLPMVGVSAYGWGVCLGRCLPKGVSVLGGVHLPPVTDACENITFLQLLLRMVTIIASTVQWWIQDFLAREGCANPGIWDKKNYYVCQKCMKMKTIGPRGGTFLAPHWILQCSGKDSPVSTPLPFTPILY